MNKIKFRGLAIEDYTGKPITEKKFVYGNVWANEDNSYVISGEYKDKKGCCYNYKVDPDSVAQFVGYDMNGDEVYEGDKMISTINSDFETTAYLDVFPEQDSELRPDTFTKFVLKECGENENLS